MIKDATRERLLTVAESLLLETGYDDVSVRSINTAAGMNPAAVHYHFGSKDGLVGALLEARLAPHWADRLATVSERRARGWTPTVAELVDVVVTPLLDLSAESLGRLHLHLLARLFLGRQQVEWSSRWFSLDPWIELLRAARPDLSAGEAARRWVLAFDLVLQTVGAPLATTLPKEKISGTTLRAFVTAGLDAA
ncbi:TetR/AcrR family transcriptional regulator [Amycolatopsis acididurans]|uniref:TetR/AcrR family transcriptional regulator n=1 Tax=Amycolatopsis acididurans TaxID=2724524 RepID=UPI0028AD887C|nr:TetR/AcrR family transcriptional regulator [Amycolatopsis acididurans]